MTAEGGIKETLSVVASTEAGSVLSYQWYEASAKNGKGAAKVAGATSAELAIPAGLAAGSYYYFCKVTVDGTHTVSTDVAEVTVE